MGLTNTPEYFCFQKGEREMDTKRIDATEDDLVRWAKYLPIENIRLEHLKFPMSAIQDADIVTITVDGNKRTLKHRFGQTD